MKKTKESKPIKKEEEDKIEISIQAEEKVSYNKSIFVTKERLQEIIIEAKTKSNKDIFDEYIDTVNDAFDSCDAELNNFQYREDGKWKNIYTASDDEAEDDDTDSDEDSEEDEDEKKE